MTPEMITKALLIAVVAWPLIVAAATACAYFFHPRWNFVRVWHYPWFAVFWISAPLPALVHALVVGDGQAGFSWLMMGSVWEAAGMRRTILGFTALLWLTAGVYGHGYLTGKAPAGVRQAGHAAWRLFRYAVIWPIALAGNILLVVATDIAGFYTGFAVMTFSAYVLVIHAESIKARKGAGAYIIMAVIGEGLILGGLLWGAGSAQTLMLSGLREYLAEPHSPVAIRFVLWLGFAVKAGVAGLHVWLPLAHPVAPAPASAVLSGAMVKAGLIGWWHTLPVGLAPLPVLGYTALIAGLAGAFGAAVYGAVQRDPKVVLAYSSVSQMGMIASLFGLAAANPDLWGATATVLVFFIVHHGLNKGALFMGTAMTDRPVRLPGWLLWAALVLPALSLAGLAGTGLAVKWAMKSVLYENDQTFLVLLLSLAAVGTALLMIRTLYLQYNAWRRVAGRTSAAPAPMSMVVSWMGCVFIASTAPWWLSMPETLPALPPPGELPGLLWPGAVGALAAAGVYWAVRSMPLVEKLASVSERLPAGDLWALYVLCARRFSSAGVKLGAAVQALLSPEMMHTVRPRHKSLTTMEKAAAWMAGREPFLRIWAGVLTAIVALALVLSMFWRP